MTPAHLTLAAVAALAAAGAAQKRGSASTKGRPRWLPEKLVEPLSVARSTLGLTDIRVSRDKKIYLIGAPRTLKGLLNTKKDGRVDRRGKADDLLMMIRRLRDRQGRLRDRPGSGYRALNTWGDVGRAVVLYLEESTGMDLGSYRVYMIPAPGGPQKVTYSVKAGKTVPATKVEPYRFCDEEPVKGGFYIESDAPVLVNYSRKKLPPIFLSHGVSLEGLDEVRKCGGFLWPSFAATWRVPESYGDVVFLADALILPSIMKPTGKPSRFPEAYLSGTDIWSPTAGNLAQREREMLEQLRGELDRHLQSDLLVQKYRQTSWDNLVGTWSSRDDLTDRITSTKKFTDIMRDTIQAHTHGSSVYTYPDEDFQSPMRHKYPYLELKVASVVKAHNMKVCLYPKQLSRRVNPRLDKLGFDGFRVPFDFDGGPRSGWGHNSGLHRVWASAATQALLKWAKDPCGYRGVRMGDHLKRQGGSKYDPTVEIYRNVYQWRRRAGRCG